MEYVLGIDLGTSYFKFGLFDRDGRLAGFSRVGVPKYATAERCELPIGDFWATIQAGIGHAATQAGARGADVAAVGYSSQANSFVLLDGDNGPLTSLILWPDSRSPHIPMSIKALWSRDDFVPTTGVGIPLSEQMAVVKWASLMNEPVWRRVRRVMTISDYLTFSLTGRSVGDAGTAALLGLLDVAALAWWPPALQAAELPEEVLSRPLRPGSLAERLTAQGAERTGLTSGTPFCVGSLDHHMAALGAGGGSLAEVSLSMGTVLACLRSCEALHPRPGTITGPGFASEEFFQLAFRNEGAGMLDVYRDTYAPGESIGNLLQMAAVAPPDCGGLRARLNAAAGRVDFEGSSASASTAMQVRAVLEAVAGGVQALLGQLGGSASPHCLVVTGGGARSGFWLQLLAERLGCEVRATDCEEPACLGAALLASHAAGWFTSLSRGAEQWIRLRHRYYPSS